MLLNTVAGKEPFLACGWSYQDLHSCWDKRLLVPELGFLCLVLVESGEVKPATTGRIFCIATAEAADW